MHVQPPSKLFLAVGAVPKRPCPLVLVVDADGRVDVANALVLLLPLTFAAARWVAVLTVEGGDSLSAAAATVDLGAGIFGPGPPLPKPAALALAKPPRPVLAVPSPPIAAFDSAEKVVLGTPVPPPPTPLDPTHILASSN